MSGVLTVPGRGEVPRAGVLHILYAAGTTEVVAVGTKSRSRSTPQARLRALTTLRLEVLGHSGAEPLSATLSIRPRDVVAMLVSLRGTGFTRGRRARALARFVRFFLVQAVRSPTS